MGLRKIYGIDTGTSTVKIYSQNRNKIYMEKNMIAVGNNRKVLAVGDKAYEMYEKAPSDIDVESPMAFGMIADIPKMEFVLSTLMEKADSRPGIGTSIFFAVPMDLSPMEIRAYDTIVNGRGIQNSRVYVVERPIVDAIALGISPDRCKGSMVVNIGGQNTEISVLSEGRVIVSKRIPIGGKQMNYAICDEVRKLCQLQIGTRTARRLKTVIGNLENDQIQARKVFGIDSLSGLPREEIIPSSVVNEALKIPLTTIAEEIKTFIERTPPQISYQIMKEGIYLSGGSTRLPGIDAFIADYVGYGVSLSQLFELCTVTGLQEIIDHKYLHKWASPIKKQK